MPDNPSAPSLGTTRLALRTVWFFLLSLAMPFIAAGRLRWRAAWAYLGLAVVILVGSRVAMDPSLRRERMRPGAGVPGWDKALAPLVAAFGPAVVSIAAGLDARRGTGGDPPPAVQAFGLGIAALGGALSSWAVNANRYFSSLVRIQRDRGHTVVEAGPYGWVRHPGYAGGILYTLSAPFALGSRRAVLPTLVLVALHVLRTYMEDRTLSRELEGYDDYARRVKYRLVPGIW